MTTTPSSSQTSTVVELPPNYIIPIVLLIGSLPIIWIQKFIGFPIALFAIFLFFQTGTIRLQFTETDLDVLRSDKLLRRFPYQDWINWEIFWEPVPILFYFREVNNIHFLPIIFDANLLKSCLEQHCGNLKK